MNKNLKRILSKHQIVQGTDEWHNTRLNMITATDCSIILEVNPFQKKSELLQKKSGKVSINENTNNTSWGNKYEKTAYNIYSKLFNKKLYEVGLLKHDKLNWLGASPDGITEDAKLLEIKCVVSRKIKDIEPFYYWVQVQIQLEVCNLDECDFFQCKFIEYKSKEEMDKDIDTQNIFKGQLEYNDNIFYWKLDHFNCKTIKRDKQWFKENVLKLHNFYNDILYFKNNKKRKSSYDENYSKKICLRKDRKYMEYNWDEWINIKDIKNYILDDPLLDWYNLYGIKKEINSKKLYNFSEFIMNKGIEFKNAVLLNLKNRFKSLFVNVANINEIYSINKYEETINYMEIGKPIICNGILHNKSNNTFGIVDLIIRSDYLNKLVNSEVLSKNEEKIGCKFNKKWHYRIINITFNTFHLYKNDLIKNIRNVVYLKSQLIMYNYALEFIQNYLPDTSYLFGKIIKTNDCLKYNAFYKLGKVNVLDNKLIEKINKSIIWLKDVKQNGMNWNPETTDKIELLPNMCNKNDYLWHQEKKELAYKNKELTLLYNIGISERKYFHKHGIYNFEQIKHTNDNKNNKISKIINNMIEINKNKNHIITPLKIDLKIHNLDKTHNYMDFYVDFETTYYLNYSFDKIINYKKGDNLLLNADKDNIIYMIGIGWIENNKWIFKNLIVNDINLSEEKRIINEFIKILNKYPKRKVFHWGNIEPMLLDKAFKLHNLNFNIGWIDLMKKFINIPINIQNNYSYGIKQIANVMYNHGFITTKWNNSTINGLDAIVVSWFAHIELEKNNITKISDYKDMNEIIKYNEIDCKAIWDILRYIRLNHI